MVIEIPQIQNDEAKNQVDNNKAVKNGNHSPRKGDDHSQGAVDRPRYNYTAAGYEYQKEELYLKYQSKDGDYLELSYASENLNAYQVNFNGDSEESENSFLEIMNKIEDYINNQNQKMIDVLFKILKGEDSEYNIKILGGEYSGELEIPEYWNAENTSQRIVDFATSFYDVAGMEGEEYGEMMLEAVKKGFEEANAILGNLPGAAGELSSETQQLTIDKLEAWIAEHSEVAVAA